MVTSSRDSQSTTTRPHGAAENAGQLAVPQATPALPKLPTSPGSALACAGVRIKRLLSAELVSDLVGHAIGSGQRSMAEACQARSIDLFGVLAALPEPLEIQMIPGLQRADPEGAPDTIASFFALGRGASAALARQAAIRATGDLARLLVANLDYAEFELVEDEEMLARMLEPLSHPHAHAFRWRHISFRATHETPDRDPLGFEILPYGPVLPDDYRTSHPVGKRSVHAVVDTEAWASPSPASRPTPSDTRQTRAGRRSAPPLSNAPRPAARRGRGRDPSHVRGLRRRGRSRWRRVRVRSVTGVFVGNQQSTVVISFLGRPAITGDGHYRGAAYRFPDSGKIRTSRVFVGALLDELAQRGTLTHKLVICGTSTSAWHALALDLLDERAEAHVRVLDAVASTSSQQQAVTDDQLRELAIPLSEKLRCSVELVLIGHCDNRQDQLEVVKRIAEAVPEPARLVLDITHGFRHLPLIGIAVAGFLEHARDCHLAAVYYGMNDARSSDPETGVEVSPVVDLKGMLRILDVSEALGAFKMSGQLTPIAAQVRQEAPGLYDAAFRIDLQRLTDQEARHAAASALNAISASPDPLLRIAVGELSEALRIASEPEVQTCVRQLAQGKRALEVRDYSSAIFLLWESLISFGVGLCATHFRMQDTMPGSLFLDGDYRQDCQLLLRWLIDARPPKDIDNRLRRIDPRSIEDAVVARLIKALPQQPGAAARKAHFHDLRQLRNAVAHGSNPRSERARAALGTPEEMHHFLSEKVRWLERLYPSEIERTAAARMPSAQNERED